MPKIVPLSERKELAPKPEPEKIDFTKMHHFDATQTTPYNLLLPDNVAKRVQRVCSKLEGMDTSKLFNQALLDLINASRGIVRKEPAKNREAWYTYEAEVQGKSTFKFKGENQTVKPTYPVLRDTPRKFIPIPGTNSVALHPNASKTTLSVDVIVRIHNEAYRLSEYFQMTYYDFCLQAVETLLHRVEPEIDALERNPNTDRLARMSEKMMRQEERTAQIAAKRIAKHVAANGGQEDARA